MHPTVPPAPVGRVFRGSDALARGLLTPAQLRSTAWRRRRQDVSVHAAVPVTHRIRVTAVTLTMPTGAVITDLSAAALWGVPDLVGPDDPVEVALPTWVRWSPASDVRARTAVDLADGLAESPQETRTRVHLARGGVPAPVAQFRVLHGDRFVARVDFAWPGRWPWSTTASGTPSRGSSPGTGPGSTHCSPRGGGWSS